MQLVAHKEFNRKEKVLSMGADELSVKRVVDEELQRKKLEIPISVNNFKIKLISSKF